MATSRTISRAEVRAALHPVLDWLDDPGEPQRPDRRTLAAAVRTTLRAFAQIHPGKAVEVRVPPFAAVQCLPGGAHTRGTPPHVVEADPRTWLLLATGRLSWSAARTRVTESPDAPGGTAELSISGHRAGEVGALLPLELATDSD